ncbi:14396_t:CDS:2 [Dentiscutata heterogama]|uniref:14396_t:CDS:1 n=1 Tax=Dentiscutata heterogama TaxID=1316150 RepID=A0ACA9M153_9GLOM|nr:14396_t:CDS:2 [Dentiscutata heterogama]
MPRKNKRKHLASELPGKRGCFAPRETVVHEEATNGSDVIAEAYENTDGTGCIDTTMQDETDCTDITAQDDTDETMRGCSKMSRTTIWRKKQKKVNALTNTNVLTTSSQQSQSESINTVILSQPILTNAITLLSRSSSKFIPTIIRNSPLFVETMAKLRMQLGQSINIETSSLATNQSNNAASNCIAQTIWDRGSYLARCVRKWGDHYVQTGELLIDHQRKHLNQKSLIKNIDFSDACQAWLHQQKPELHSPCALKAYIEKALLPQMAEKIKKKNYL